MPQALGKPDLRELCVVRVLKGLHVCTCAGGATPRFLSWPRGKPHLPELPGLKASACCEACFTARCCCICMQGSSQCLLP